MYVTPEQCREAAEKVGKPYQIKHHRCGLCRYMTRYLIDLKSPTPVVFDAGCDCTGGQELRDADFDALASWVNMQRQEVNAARVWDSINGIDVGEP